MKKIFLLLVFLWALTGSDAQSSCFSLYMETQSAQTGDTVCLDVKVKDFIEMVSMQYSFNWDPSQLSLTEVNDLNLPNLSENNFNLTPSYLTDGFTVFSWFDINNPDGVTLSDESIIFSLCFEVLSTTSGAQLPVSFSEQPLLTELVKAPANTLSIYSLVDGSIIVSGNGNYPAIDSLCLSADQCGNTQNAYLLVSDGIPPYTFEWKDSAGNIVATTESLTDVASGQYYFKATDSNSYEVSGTVNLSPTDDLLLDFSYDCDGNTADVTVDASGSSGSAPYTFEWSTGFSEISDSTSILSNVPVGGNYSVTVTSNEGCIGIDSVDIPSNCNQASDFIIAHSYNCIFFNDMPSSAELSVVVWTGGVPPYTFEWSTGEVTNQQDPSTPLGSINVPGNGTYSVTVVDSEGTTEEYGPMILDCDNNQLDLDAELLVICQSPFEATIEAIAVNGTAPYTFDWSNGVSETTNSASIVSVDPTNEHIVTITDSQGSVYVSDTLLINCLSLPVQFTAQDATVDAGESFCTDVTVSNFNDIVSFQYSMNWNEAVFTFDSVQINSGLNGFDNNSFNLSNTDDGFLTVSWFEPNTQPSSLPDNTVLFSLCFTAENTAGSSEIMFSNTPTVIEVSDGQTTLPYQATNSTVTINSPSTFLIAHNFACINYQGAPDSADISVIIWTGGVPPYTFDWSTGESSVENIPDINGSTIRVAGSGDYFVTVTDDNGTSQAYGPMIIDCEDATENVILTPSIVCLSDTTAEIIINIEAGVSPYTVQWSTGQEEVASGSSAIIVDEDGIYSVTVTDASGNSNELTALSVDCGLTGGENFLLAHSIECILFPDSTEANISLAVWTGGEMPYTLDWSTGESETVNDPFNPFSTITAPGDGSYTVTVTDVNGLSQVYGPIEPNCSNLDQSVKLSVEDAEVSAGDEFCLDISVEDFTDVSSVQFTVAWDPASLSFDSIIIGNVLPGLELNSDFNLQNANNGYLIMSWFELSLEQISLPDGAVLFSICYTAGDLADSTNVVFSSSPAVTEITNGTESLPVVINNGLVVNSGPMVWPGDTDTDGEVEHFDLLNIGLAYGAAGPERPNASLAWQGQAALNWNQSTPQSNIDYKHIDTNGDGFIDAADTLALQLNWGEESPFNSPEPPTDRTANTTIFVQPDTLLLGEENVWNIVMGQEESPAENVYGVAFTIIYDTAAVEAGSAFASFTESWIGDQNQNMLTFYQDNYEEGRLDIAITRTDGLNMSGDGAIAQLHITIQDVIFLRSQDYLLLFDIENIRLISYQEEEIAIGSKLTTSLIRDAISNINNEALFSTDVVAFPNPASNVLYLRSKGIIEHIELSSIAGENILSIQGTNQIPVEKIAAGTYLLKTWTTEGFSIQRVVIMK